MLKNKKSTNARNVFSSFPMYSVIFLYFKKCKFFLSLIFPFIQNWIKYGKLKASFDKRLPMFVMVGWSLPENVIFYWSPARDNQNRGTLLRQEVIYKTTLFFRGSKTSVHIFLNASNLYHFDNDKVLVSWQKWLILPDQITQKQIFSTWFDSFISKKSMITDNN